MSKLDNSFILNFSSKLHGNEMPTANSLVPVPYRELEGSVPVTAAQFLCRDIKLRPSASEKNRQGVTDDLKATQSGVVHI